MKNMMVEGAPKQILSDGEVWYGVGFNKFWDREDRYEFNEDGLVNPIEKVGDEWLSLDRGEGCVPV